MSKQQPSCWVLAWACVELVQVFNLVQAERDSGAQSDEGRSLELADEELEYRLFRSKHRDQEQVDAIGYDNRFALWRKARARIDAHNARPDVIWKAAVNRFADYTEAEFKALLGHTPLRGNTRAAAFGPRRSSFFEVSETASPNQSHRGLQLAQSLDWRQKLKSVDNVLNQGSCGSCWAVSAIGALQMQVEFQTGRAVGDLSWNQVKDCSNNTRKCGGTGGCQGSTGELAYAYIASTGGLALHSTYKGNRHMDEECRMTVPHVTISGYKRLEENRLQPLLAALNQDGPVVVSIDATGWNAYGSGIYDGCTPDTVVNHGVALVGYGTDSSVSKDYWLIRNSWGKGWGEDGFIRVLRHLGDIDDYHGQNSGYCGLDSKPQEGVGCEGEEGPWVVCGMCGILSDSCYPVGVKFVEHPVKQVVNWNTRWQPNLAGSSSQPAT
eukprot:TRINITY_DN32740_c0_g1_i1.p1 TRINITY_DN32740_c0_g1~~TRINITY_DN32740_c0_g1_i1.p1  ORF type:complete len:438 (+),score=56.30 TRINITY_DN32740_c0_g1_i1:71-1384(+)